MSSRLYPRPAAHAGYIVGTVLASALVLLMLFFGFVGGYTLHRVVLVVLCTLAFLRAARLAVFPFVVLERDGLVVRMTWRTLRIPLGDIAAVDHRPATSRNATGDRFNPAITRTDGTELVLTKAAYRLDSAHQWRVQDFFEEVDRRRPVRPHANLDASTPR